MGGMIYKLLDRATKPNHAGGRTRLRRTKPHGSDMMESLLTIHVSYRSEEIEFELKRPISLE